MTFDKIVRLFFMALILLQAFNFLKSTRKTVAKSDTFVNVIFVPVYLLFVIVSMICYCLL